MVRVNCDQCSQTFNTKKLFVSHLITKSCHKSIREAAKSQSRNKAQQEENFDYPTLEIVPVQDCPQCRRFSKAGMQMYMLSHLACHVRSKAEYFECEDCSVRFDTANYLEKHENKKHKNEKCDDCPKKFKLYTLLQKHVEGVHKTESCKDCDYKAKTKDSLETHIYNSHPTDICEECGMAFENPSAVEKHFQDIHEKIKCDDCDAEFDCEELLENHKVDSHNQTKTTFKQFGGGLMMMMITENPEPTEKESEAKDDNVLNSNLDVTKEENILVEETIGKESLKDEEIKDTKDEEIEDTKEEEIKDTRAREEEIKDTLEVSSAMEEKSENINVFGAGFFMVYQEEPEYNPEPEGKNHDDNPQESNEEFSASKKRCYDDGPTGESIEDAKVIKRIKQTLETESVTDGNNITDLAVVIGNPLEPMEARDQGVEGKDGK
eukprot:GFUD01034859.1.p1 GENE.GFUD01034859.1~~GFUD01034859.1.p1  ORF type:complete len:435 (-),score=132.27 GFUD01034859.1:113-1417(-)